MAGTRKTIFLFRTKTEFCVGLCLEESSMVIQRVPLSSSEVLMRVYRSRCGRARRIWMMCWPSNRTLGVYPLRIGIVT